MIKKFESFNVSKEFLNDPEVKALMECFQNVSDIDNMYIIINVFDHRSGYKNDILYETILNWRLSDSSFFDPNNFEKFSEIIMEIQESINRVLDHGFYVGSFQFESFKGNIKIFKNSKEKRSKNEVS